MTALRIVSATADDLGQYIDLLEELADWLTRRGINQWCPGSFRLSIDYYSQSITRGEVQLAFLDEALVGSFRLLSREPIVWPEIDADDAVYVYNLAVRRQWAGQQLGTRLLASAEQRASEVGRRFVRLDCLADNAFLRRYYMRAGFVARGEIDAEFPAPVGTLRLQRYEKQIEPHFAAA
jgi:ribosomal protein S18 acetylase RimI-like enzyme